MTENLSNRRKLHQRNHQCYAPFTCESQYIYHAIENYRNIKEYNVIRCLFESGCNWQHKTPEDLPWWISEIAVELIRKEQQP